MRRLELAIALELRGLFFDLATDDGAVGGGGAKPGTLPLAPLPFALLSQPLSVEDARDARSGSAVRGGERDCAIEGTAPADAGSGAGVAGGDCSGRLACDPDDFADEDEALALRRASIAAALSSGLS